MLARLALPRSRLTGLRQHLPSACRSLTHRTTSSAGLPPSPSSPSHHILKRTFLTTLSRGPSFLRAILPPVAFGGIWLCAYGSMQMLQEDLHEIRKTIRDINVEIAEIKGRVDNLEQGARRRGWW
ncbi:hypothetical protein JCM10213_005516 [Rhodosporidiobolus nylandii]